MKTKTLEIGDLVTKGTKKYRILNIRESTVTICDATSSSIQISYISKSTLIQWVEEESTSITRKPTHIIDENALSLLFLIVES
ncbi:MAG: hypothetical protein IKE36_02935 [Solobacterium sp.]|nr:hypothetical protein [Solobacterium sp.]